MLTMVNYYRRDRGVFAKPIETSVIRPSYNIHDVV